MEESLGYKAYKEIVFFLLGIVAVPMSTFFSCSEDHPDTSPMNKIQQFSCFRNHIQELARGISIYTY